MVVFETKNKSQFRGDIVVIKTTTIEEKSDTEAVLQIKFGKKKIAFSDNTNWTCVYWDHSSKMNSYFIMINFFSFGTLITKVFSQFPNGVMKESRQNLSQNS